MAQDAGPDDCLTIMLPMDLTMASMHDLHAALGTALLQTRPLHLDAAEVDRCDTAGLQLLLACRRTAQAHQQDLQILHAPPALLTVAASLGLSAALGVPVPELEHA